MAVINAFRQLTDSINDTVVGMMIMLVGNVCNIVLNWLLIFGNWGFPELGIVGEIDEIAFDDDGDGDIDFYDDLDDDGLFDDFTDDDLIDDDFL